MVLKWRGFINHGSTLVFLGVPIRGTRTMIFWVIYWGPPILGSHHIWGKGSSDG